MVGASIPSTDPTPSVFSQRDNDFDIWDLPDDNTWFMWGLLLTVAAPYQPLHVGYLSKNRVGLSLNLSKVRSLGN